MVTGIYNSSRISRPERSEKQLAGPLTELSRNEIVQRFALDTGGEKERRKFPFEIVVVVVVVPNESN